MHTFRENAVSNSNTPPGALRARAYDTGDEGKPVDIQLAVADNPNTPADILVALSQIEDNEGASKEDTRYAAKNNLKSRESEEEIPHAA